MEDSGMGFRDLDLKLSYESKSDNSHLLDDFYIPVLQNSKQYLRVAGFFSSSALSVVAEGIEGLINNKGTMYLLISPKLSREDYEVTRQAGTLETDTSIFRDFSLAHLTDSIRDDRIRALSWMLANGSLKIKIVVSKKSQTSLFHEKFGIFFDQHGDKISFSGSINESAQGWIENIEEFKVFRSWISEQDKYLEADQKKFLQYWKKQHSDIAEIYDIPQAIKDEIISVKPTNVEDLQIMRRYVYKCSQKEISLFKHQQAAVDKWNQNHKRLLMEMATGTGKTRTALGCMLSLLNQNAHRKKPSQILVIVATPQNTLSRQWADDCKDLDIHLDEDAIIDGTNKKWRTDLSKILLHLSLGSTKTAIIFSNHATVSNPDFLKIIKEKKKRTEILFICDEVHGIGSQKQREALIPDYEYRVGLSATPTRMFDEEGTDLIRCYFGNKSFEFTIRQALHEINPATGKPFLNNYKYVPIFVELDEEEQNSWNLFTQRATVLSQKKEKDPDNWTDDDETRLQRIYENRANICKNAKEKIPKFKELILKDLGIKLQDTIIFVSPEQLNDCVQFLGDQDITRAKITEETSTSGSVNLKGETERQEYISKFANQKIQVLLGMKCLDEGIDISSARIAILMSNSSNPREYIQRVGRVIRPFPNKKESLIYDFVVMSNQDHLGSPKEDSHTRPKDKVLEKEARRTKIIAENALNYDKVKTDFANRGVDLDDYQ